MSAEQLNWRDGTETLTSGETLLWDVSEDGEIMLIIRDAYGEDEVIYLSELHTENAITGLSFQLQKARETRRG